MSKAELEIKRAQPIGLTKRTRKRSIKAILPDLNPPGGEIKSVSPTARTFKPVISASGWLTRQRDWRFNSILIAGMSEIFVLPVGLGVGFSLPPAIGGFVVGGAALAQLMWIPAGVFSARIHRAKSMNFNAFLQWLHGRYGITLDSKQRLYSLLSNKYAPIADAVPFVDDQGRPLDIEWSYTSDAFAVSDRIQHREPAQLVDAALVVQSTQPAAELSVPLRQLYRQIQERLTTLAERNLSPESDHVVARAKRDVVKIIALYEDLARLHALDAEQEGAVQATFTSLVNELTEVVKKETAFALRELTVETTYVAARQEPKGIQLKK